MRDIKFRAWDVRDEKMDNNPFCWPSSIDLKDSYNNLNTLISDQFGEVHHGGPVGEDNTHMRYLMQYTGLKDKNGKEIYEGDVVKIHYEDSPDFIAKVFYHERWGTFEVAATGNTIGWYADLKNCIEIIGNIYENPKLLDSHQ